MGSAEAGKRGTTMDKVFQRHQSPMLLIDPVSGQILNANQAALRFYGYQEARMRQLRISDINILSEAEVKVEMGRAASEHRNYFVFRHRLANGEIRDVEVHSSPVHTDDGDFLFSIIYDISERRRIEQALARSEAFSSSMLKAIPLPVFYKDCEGRYMDCNQSFLDWTGQQREKLIGRTVFELWDPELAQAYDARDRELMDGQQPIQEYEGKMIDSDGHERDVLFHKAQVHDHDGQLVGMVGVVLDITDRKRTEESIRQQALHDELTRLPNRRLIRQPLQQVQVASSQSGFYAALLFLDLDNFKPLNDSHGHEAGDQLLIEVAQRLKASVRQRDTVGRLGGDEFVVILDALGESREQSCARALRLAEKIRHVLGQPYHLGEIEHSCSASIGVVLFGSYEHSVDSLLHQADLAMYEAKSEGRNRVCLHQPQLRH